MLHKSIVSHKIKVSSLTLHYLSNQSDGQSPHKPKLIFLHGFPEFSMGWVNQLNHFADDFTVIAPDLPGYGQSEKPLSIDQYAVPNLIKMMAEFIRVVSQGEKVFLVAHDWGGAIAWPLVAFHADLIDKLVILNAAHPSTFTREMIHNPVQREKSLYIHTLIDKNAEATLEVNEFSYLREALFEQLLSKPFSSEQEQAYISAWSQSGALTGMLSYYRAMPQLAPAEDKTNQGPVVKLQDMHIPNIKINVPTLVLWGVKDTAFCIEVLDGLEEYIDDLHIHRHEKVGHWIQHDAAEWVNKHIGLFLT